MKKIAIVCAVLLAALYVNPAAAAGLSIDKVIVDFKPGDKPIDNINITNQSDKPLKVTVNSIEVTHSDLPDQKETPTDKLVVAPKAFELAPGEQRPVRLVLRGFPDDMEAIYRVRFVPSTPTEQRTQQVDGKSVQVSIIVSMGALIMVAPKTPKPDLKFAREGGKIHFTNAGNVTALIQREDFCTEDKKTCASLDGKRMYPGTTWDMDVPEKLKTMAFSQTMQINGAYSKLSYPAP
jgi:P pilus assembly chaperone PapD